MTQYTVVFEKSATGWSAYYPDLPGLASAGPTFEETQRLTREGIELHLGLMATDGDPIPPPLHIGDMVELEIPEFSGTVRRPEAKAA